MKLSLFLLLNFIFSQLIIAQADEEEFYYIEEVYTLFEPEIVIPYLSSDTENIVSVVLKSIDKDNFDFYRISSDNELYLGLDADSVMKDHGIVLQDGSYNLSLIKSLDLIFYLQYNQNGVLLDKELNVISLTIDVNRMEENMPKYDRLILHNTNNDLENLLLEHYSVSDDYSGKSYWSVLHSIDISSFKQESQFIPSTMVNGDIEPNKVRSSITDYNDIVFDSGILQLRLLQGGNYNETEWDDLCVNYFPAFDRDKNSYAAPCDIPDSILQNDIFKNLAMFAYVEYDYISISKYLEEALMNNSLPVYEFDSSMYLNRIIPYDSVKKNWIFTELISQFEKDSSGNWIRWDYYYPRSIRDLYVLELKTKNFTVPIAFAPCKSWTEYGYDWKNYCSITYTNYDAYGFIPINRKMIQYLSQHEAYYPCKPHMTLLEYLMNRLYSGTIVHTRPIENDEWQEMLKVLE